MIEYATGFTQALGPEVAAAELATEVELALGGPDRIGGGLLLVTSASGSESFEIGRCLRGRWPGATLLGTSFEGLLARGRVWRDEPAAGLIAWAEGPEEPVPFLFVASELDPAELARELFEDAGRARFDAHDVLLLFPDSLASTRLEATFADLLPRLGGPSVAGAAASGIGGGAALAWCGDEQRPSASLGLLIPGGSALAGPRVRFAPASRFASPWLEISECRERWIDGLDGEPPLDWVRRQLGLAPDEPVEPYLDRLLVRLRDAPVGADRLPPPLWDAAEEERGEFVERYVIGLDDRCGSISIPGGFRRGGHLALALPDAVRARETLREAVRALTPTPLLMQFTCRARDAALHGDGDVESALVAHDARDRSILGTLAPFQLGSDARGLCRMLVHSTVLAAVGGP